MVMVIIYTGLCHVKHVKVIILDRSDIESTVSVRASGKCLNWHPGSLSQLCWRIVEREQGQWELTYLCILSMGHYKYTQWETINHKPSGDSHPFYEQRVVYLSVIERQRGDFLLSHLWASKLLHDIVCALLLVPLHILLCIIQEGTSKATLNCLFCLSPMA